MTHVPLFLDLSGRSVLVVGAGAVGARRARELARGGAEVTVVDPRPPKRLPRRCRLLRRRFRPADAAGRLLVVAATGDGALDARVAGCARAAGALVNLASSAGRSEVWMPAVLRRGPLVIAVGTGGASPALAGRIRRELAGAYGAAYGVQLRLLEGMRRSARRRIPDAALRRAVLRRLSSPVFRRLCAREGAAAARAAMRRVLERAARPPRRRRARVFQVSSPGGLATDD